MKNTVPTVCYFLAVALCQINGIKSARIPKIIDGKDAKLGEIPYQVSIQIGEDHGCGGSIISEYWVVTAAHCVYWYHSAEITVVAGTVDLQEPYSTHQAVRKICHENYTAHDSFRNDIALVKVSTPFEFSSRIDKVILPETHAEVEKNTMAVVSGWGDTSDHVDSASDVLQKAKVFITDEEFCSAAVKAKEMNVYPTNICASNPNVTRGECHGDSGGPLTVDGILTGIVSWSIKDLGCANPEFPGVFTRVSEYIEWIRENAKR